ncbi:alpha-hydroxy-acid oxidizing protein [Anaerorhabdus furcosa]|uniref:L-lactate oxidase n=1 Tax=Anaerorhabdus furcosa TaxID=118967 RepID=A0A1T4LJY3_9FIRM|nr:alpha-hydroxy-acid oxidizing protein [Anaerorhabdus furcosa]SJZ55049.1 FMN-dependent dehydrogenase, includes L-lactate dehydrogenase and type II isopentenyl diphosphate isomerase [Anaerorhabdus furcosa]
MKREANLCKQCPVCNGLACKGQIPGVGGIGQGNSFINNVKELQKVKLLMDVVNDIQEVNPETTLFNKKYAFPLLVAPIAGIKNNYGTDIPDYVYNSELAKACDEQGISCFVGDGIDMENFFHLPARAIHEQGGQGFVTIKPWAMEKVIERINLVKEFDVLGIAMDVDAAGLPLLRNSVTPVENKDEKALREIKKLCDGKPFIVKGIMTTEAAIAAVNAGADGIVISNHGGRVLDDCCATIDVLEEIVAAVKGKTTILIDGGFRTGTDIYKAIALGADGVLIGRPIALACATEGVEGANKIISKLKSEFQHAMRMTGCATISDITKRKIKKQTM